MEDIDEIELLNNRKMWLSNTGTCEKLDEVNSLNQKIVDEMILNKVFHVFYQDGYFLTEDCDEEFLVELTKERCLALSKYFTELSDIIE